MKKCWLLVVMVLAFSLLFVVPVFASGLSGTENVEEMILNAINQDSLIANTWTVMDGYTGPVGNRIYNLRTPGAPSQDLAIDNIVEAFENWGLDDVEIWENPTVLNNVWDLKTWQIETDAYSFLPYGTWPCRNSPAGDVTAQLVYVGMGTSAANYMDANGNSIVSGKIVLADNTSCSSVYTQAIAKGAIGVININKKGAYNPDTNGYDVHPYSSELVGPGSITYSASNTVPAATVSYDDGQNLKAILATKAVTLHLMVDAEIIPTAHSKSVIATIDGTDPSKCFMLYGHLNADSYGPGCDDTASGEACIMEIARVMQTLINEGKIQRPEYSVKFFFIGSENRDSPAYLDSLTAEEKAAIIGSINFDQAGLNVEHDINNIEASDRALSRELLLTCQDILADHSELAPYFQYIDYEGGSDHDSFLNAGIPTCYIWSDWTYRLTKNPNPPEFGGERVWIAGNPYYHTSADTMENTVLREPWNEVHIASLCALLTARFVGLDQIGYLAPLEYGKTYKVGSAIPVKFQITDGAGGYISDTVAEIYVDGAAGKSTGSNSSNVFKYDFEYNQYVLNLDTQGMSKGQHTIEVRLESGATLLQTMIKIK